MLNRPKSEGGPPDGESLSPETLEVPKPPEEKTEKIEEKKLSGETAGPKEKKLKEGIEKKREEEKKKIQEAFRRILFKAQGLITNAVIEKIEEPKAKAKLEEFIKNQSKIQEYISGEDKKIASYAWSYGRKYLEDEFISWAMKIFSEKILEGIEQKFPVEKPEEKEEKPEKLLEKPEIVKPEEEITKPEELKTPGFGYTSRVAREAYKRGEEDVQKQQIAESNKEFLSGFAPNKTGKEVFEQFLNKWKMIQEMREEVDINKASLDIKKKVDFVTSAIENAIRWRDLSTLHSNLEKFKKILEDYKLEEKKSRDEI